MVRFTSLPVRRLLQTLKHFVANHKNCWFGSKLLSVNVMAIKGVNQLNEQTIESFGDQILGLFERYLPERRDCIEVNTRLVWLSPGVRHMSGLFGDSQTSEASVLSLIESSIDANNATLLPQNTQPFNVLPPNWELHNEWHDSSSAFHAILHTCYELRICGNTPNTPNAITLKANNDMLPLSGTVWMLMPFVASLVAILIFSVLYVKRYRNPYESDRCSTITSIVALFVSLLTCALIPVDIFIVSFMKDSSAHFKDWALNITQRDAIENSAILIFSVLYVKRYRNPYESDRCTTITSIVALFVSLLTCALIPVDIFIVSFMKDSSAHFKDWALNITQRDAIENSVLYSYYTLYSLIFFCVFILIPFVYFYYEEKSEEGFTSEGRFCGAFKYSVGFLFVAVILLLIGAFIPLHEYHPHNNGTNSSSEWIDDMKFILDDLSRNRGEDALSMVLSILSSVGVIYLVIFTGFGMFSFPIGLIRGTRSARMEIERIQDSHLANQTKINALRDRERIGNRLTPREKRQLVKLEENERIITREEEYLLTYRGSLFYKLRNLVRPLQIGLGLLAIILSLIVWISLLITNIDKAMHSLGMEMGYALPKPQIPNPIDIILVTFQRVFPLDYILILLMSLFFVLATMSGLKNLGIWFFFVRLYKIRVKKSSPQALLMLFGTLMLTTLGINILFYCISPQYVTFGSQHYINATANNTVSICSSKASSDDCTMTRVSRLLVRFFYKAWFFGAFYYWSMWAFIGDSGWSRHWLPEYLLLLELLSLLLDSPIYVILRPTRSVTEGLIDDDDLEESDDDLRA
ncbi:unnamed protein product [Medioppia subpectinata]|uniref:Lysosomal cobalamin transporter n=1 Tax=Medioppia subpectinata TaxID=1979941 RepID=A0A7R9KG73_9ACAR|nr:unnamed protein product [Medioppia subpectinata]CAG2101600.1 unnamed protein product [Medioppia subpectinata]